MADSNFVDYVKIYCRSGKGGKGSMHLRHVKYNPNGGPDGGDGGRGGSIILRGNHNYWTLLHLKYQRHVFAEHGGNGGRDKCHGTDGKDMYIDVPCGTVVYDAETGKYICDVTYDGQEVMLLKGGRGGLGNFQFRTATNQAPRFAQPGEPMQERTVIMTNSLPWLVNFYKKQGVFAEVVSKDEYGLAKYLGFRDDEIVYNGPYKDETSFRDVILAGG